ncbi:homoserine O-acetyltransferase MetX [Mizugakiibacter sediminis]|uniref:Serine O-succinyltransferase n=2 Tax=Mizugakiibacter sediminis TaxID=1475481 RepID=A0A0S6YX96_9GAMM|nr:homoserine O-acetyltransferase [Mizugakiibacter sediminis]
MADARRYFDLPSPFRMKRGGELRGARLAYETWGTPSAARDNAVLILTGLSPGAHAASNAEDPSPGWWEGIVGPGKAIDTDRFFVVCVNSLGSCKGSTGPASIDPATGEPYRLDFPELTLEDVGNAAYELARGLGIERLACLVGCSMGGMSALGYMLHHPGSVRAHVSISTAPQAQPFAIAIRSLQREAIRLDPNWNEGRYDDAHYPEMGMHIARKLGVITYRSAIEWSGRFGRIRLEPDKREEDPFGAEFQIESYLQGHARRFARSFDPNCYLYLSRASDWFDVAEYGHGSIAEGMRRIRLERALVIGVETDILFPLQQQEQIAMGLREAGAEVDFVALDSPQGHDAFLVDIERFGAAIGAFMAKL